MGPVFFHNFIFIRRAHLSVQTGHLYLRWQYAFQLFRIGDRIFHPFHLPFFHHRAYDIDLMPHPHFLFYKTICLVPVFRPHNTILNRQSVCGQFIYNGNVQIPIENERQRPRYRRRAHYHHMHTLAFSCQPFPLPHAEPVLFIRHHQRQIFILRLFLYQSMGADHHVRPSVPYCLISFPLFLHRHGTRQKHRTKRKPVFFRQFLHCLIVLQRQYFRRCHHSPLITVGYAHQQRKKRKYGLSRSHIALDQPVHHLIARKILFYFLPHFKLCCRQRIRQGFCQSFGLSRLHHRITAFQLLVMILAPSQRHEKEKEFIKNQPPPRLQHAFIIRREMNRFHRLAIWHKTLFFPDPCRQRILFPIQKSQCLSDCLCHHVVRQAGRKRIFRL